MTLPNAEAAIARDLLRASAADLLKTLRLPAHPFLLRTISPLLAPMLRFVDDVAGFDLDVGRHGLTQAGKSCLDRWNIQLDVDMPLPRDLASGPLIITANHPGLSDALALFAWLERDDLLAIAEQNPFLEAMVHTRERLLFIGEANGDRRQVLRQASSHLAEGGALLLFPAGRIEPDPMLHDDANRELPRWSRSAELLQREVPACRVLPVALGGVLHLGAQHHPLARLRRSRFQHERSAAALQLAHRRWWSVRVLLRQAEPFGPDRPLQSGDLAAAMEELFDRFPSARQDAVQRTL